VRNWNKICGGIGRKKKDLINYEFDKINNAGKFDWWNVEVLETLFIDKYHRTHDEFMNTPRNVIQIILLKRQSDSKAEKKRKIALNNKRK